MKEVVIAWILSLIVSFAPPDKMAAGPQFPGWEETADQKMERYTSIATDLYETIFEEDNVVPVFGGKMGKLHSAVLVLAVAAHESGFAKDVDKGPCYREGSFKRRCDSGHAYCMLQVHVGPNGKTREGWTAEEISTDRKKCFIAAMNGMRKSIRACQKAKVPPEKWLAVYASGSCDRGHTGAEELWSMYQTFLAKKKVPQATEERKPSGS